MLGSAEDRDIIGFWDGRVGRDDGNDLVHSNSSLYKWKDSGIVTFVISVQCHTGNLEAELEQEIMSWTVDWRFWRPEAVAIVQVSVKEVKIVVVGVDEWI